MSIQTEIAALDWSEFDDGFVYACQRTLIREGRLSDNPNDRGGLTKYGITKATAARYGLEVRNLTLEQAVDIYGAEYWVLCGAPNFPMSKYLQAELFDTAVLSGPSTSIRLLQKAYNVLFADRKPLLEDARIGPKTTGAIIALLPRWEKTLLNAYNGEQYDFFESIISHSASQRVFIRGWVGKRLDVPDDATEA